MANDNECPVCMNEVLDGYKINCGATVDHVICHSCETTLRLSMPITSQGRRLKCPMCREEEHGPGDRSKTSLQTELNAVYSQVRETQLNPVRAIPSRSFLENTIMSILQTPGVRQAVDHLQLLRNQRERERVPILQVPQVTLRQRTWCQSGRRELNRCPTQSKTIRKCSYRGCTRNVCRSCKICSSH